MPPGWQLTAGEVEDGIGELVEGGEVVLGWVL